MLGKIQLKRLRQDIVLNSIYTNDYINRYDIDPLQVQNFFDSYLEYLNDLMQENNIQDLYFFDFLDQYDTLENLYNYYYFYFDYDPLEKQKKILANTKLAKTILKQFNYYDFDKTKQEHYNDILTSLKTNDKQDILIILDYFKELENQTKTTQTIIYNLENKLKGI